MPVVVKPVSLQRSIVLRDLSLQRTSVAINALAFAATRSHDEMAGFTPRLAAVKSLISRLTPGATLSESLLLAADGFGTLANALEMTGASDQLRAAKSLYDPALLGEAALISYGVSDPGRFPFLDPGIFAIIMTAGAVDQASRNSQQLTMELCDLVLKGRENYIPAGTSSSSDVVEGLVFARLCEYLTHFSSASQAADLTTTLTADRKEHILRRVATLRAIARELAGIAIGPAAVYADHLGRILSHPWITRVTFGRTSDEVTRALKQLAEGRTAQAVRPSWPEFSVPDCYDPRMLGWATMLDTMPSPVTEVKVGSDRTVHPLSPDLSFPVDIKPADVDRWLSLIWAGVTRVEQALKLTAGPETGQAPGFPSPVAQLTPPDGTPVIAPEHGYPLIPQGSSLVLWPDDRVTPGTLGLSSWTPITYAGMRETIARVAPRTLIFVRGSEEPRPMSALAPLMPAAGVLAKALPIHALSTQTLCLMWGMAEIEWHDMLRATSGDASSLQLRALADALRFLGVMEVKSPTGRATGTVHPLDRMFYHAINIHEELLGEPIVLTEFVHDGSKITIHLRPFKAIPTSARLDEIASNVNFEPTAESRPVRPYAKWLSTNPASAEKGLEIIGVIGPDASVTDIVSVPSLYDGTYVTIIGDEAKAMARREDNAVWTLTHEDSLPEFAASVVPAKRVLLER